VPAPPIPGTAPFEEGEPLGASASSGASPGENASPDENTLKKLRECPQCGLICKMPALRIGIVADCPRCGHALWRHQKHPFKYVLACGLAAAVFYCFALAAPFLEISAYGRFQLAKIQTGPGQLYQTGFELVGLLVLAVTVIFPGIKIAMLLVTLIGIETKFLPARILKSIFRWYEPIRPWAMIDVYLLGFLVAYTRLIAMASVHLDTALFALIGVMISTAAADAALDTETVWTALDDADKASNPSHPSAHSREPDRISTPPNSVAARIIGCHRCDLVNFAAPGAQCARCHATLHLRKANSLGHSLAFLIAAAVFYIPANVFPVMSITTLGVAEPFTIMAGIVELAQANLWPLAALVFLASITIPLAKLVTLAYLLLQTGTGRFAHLLSNTKSNTKAYRVIKFIGRWSMIDVFMISILVALVRFGQFANVQAEPGAPCFAAVVVLTMFAVDLFDPRLMWDKRPRARPRSNPEIDSSIKAEQI
jgi:paraquat-inducible protein A